MEKEILKKARGLLCSRNEVKYSFIAHNKKTWPIDRMCRLLGVRRNGYYHFQNQFFCMLTQKLKRYRDPLEIISYTIWSYHRFNDSYRDVQERLLYRGIVVSHETIRAWCIQFKQLCKTTLHLQHKGLNNRVENAHQPTPRKEKCLIRFKLPKESNPCFFNG